MGYQTGIYNYLKKYGLNVVTIPGWQSRGSATFSPRGGVAHHTAGPASGNIPSLNTLIYGRSDVPGPLCHVGLARDGTCFLVAAGRANHAGYGGYRGLSGNTSVWGIEAENTGVGEPWSSQQLDAYYRCAAAMADYSGFDASWWCGHKEWTSRKPDPNGIDMNSFRSKVDYYLKGGGSLNEKDIANLVGWKNLEMWEKLIKPELQELKNTEFKSRRILADLLDHLVNEQGISGETRAYLDQIRKKYK